MSVSSFYLLSIEMRCKVMFIRYLYDVVLLSNSILKQKYSRKTICITLLVSVLYKHRINRVQYRIYKQNSGGNQMSVYQRRARGARREAVRRSGSSPLKRLYCAVVQTRHNLIELNWETRCSVMWKIITPSGCYLRRFHAPVAGAKLMEIQPMIICFLHH